MKIINFGTSPTDRVQNKTVRGIAFTTKLIHAALNTAFVANDFDYSQIILKVTLMRNGRAYILAQDNLRNLVAGSNYFNPLFLTAKGFLNGLQVIAAHGVGANAQAISQVMVDFGCPVNVHGRDVLIAEVQCPLGAISQANVNSNTSTIQMDWVIGVGSEFAIPFMKCYTLQASEQNQNVPMGDNIVDIVFLNYDKANHLSATSVISSATLKNDKYQPSWYYDQLIGRKNQSFPTSAEADLRYQSFCIYDNDRVDLDGCELHLQLNPTQVAASQNVVYYRGYFHDPGTFERGHALHRKAMEKRVDKVYGQGAVANHAAATAGRG